MFDDPKFIEFGIIRDLKPQTMEFYGTVMTRYCRFTGLTPSELIEEAIAEEEAMVRMINRKIREYFVNHQIQLQSENLSRNYISKSISMIRTFYRHYGIELPYIPPLRRKTHQLITSQDIPTKENIRRAISYANPKYKAMILLMSSSGMGRAEIRSLTYGHLMKAYEPVGLNDLSDMLEVVNILRENKDHIPTWNIKRIKTGMPYFTFSTPETTEALADYLEWNISQEGNPKTPKSPLFSVHGKPMGGHGINDYFQKLNELCGFGTRGRLIFFRSHAMRKYFATTLQKNNVQQLVTDWLLGHVVKGTTNAYFKPDEKALRREYRRIVPELSLEKVKIKELTTKEYDDLLIALRKKDDDYRKLEHRMELMERIMSDNELLKELKKRF